MPRLPRNNAPRVSGIAYLDVSHAGETYRINLRRTAAARRFTLRVRAATHDVVLTMPARGSVSEAKSFAGRHAAWIGAKLRRLPVTIPFAPGAFVPLRGTLHRITHCPATRGRVWIEDGAASPENSAGPLLCVSAEAPFVPRRVRDFLIKEALRDIKAAVASHAKKAWSRAAENHLAGYHDPVGILLCVGRAKLFLAADHGASFRARLPRGA